METTASLETLESVVRPHLKFLGGDDPLDPEQDLGEVGLDSMASIDLLLDLEAHFGIAIPDELLTENSFATLSAIRELVDEAQG